MRSVFEFLNYVDCPKALKADIKMFYDHRYPRKTLFDERMVYSELPPKFMKRLVLHRFEKTVHFVPFFRACSDECIVAICPDNGSVLGEKPPAELTPSVPVLFVCGENDTDAPPQAHAWAHYRKTGGAKLLFEIEGGTHYSANGPAGDATEDETIEGASVMALLCNSTCALLSQGACVPCPCRRSLAWAPRYSAPFG